MTYQTPAPTLKHDDDVTVEEVSALLSGPGGVPAGTKKTLGAPMRAMLATTWVVLGILAVVYYGGRSRSNSNHRGPLEDPPPRWNKDNNMMVVDVQEEEQGRQGDRCCPKDADGCTSYHNQGPGVNCNNEGWDWRIDGHKVLDDGTMCRPRIGGFCCAESTSKHYTWYAIHIGGCTGCCRNDGNCFKCSSGKNCCSGGGWGHWDFTCPGCEGSF